MAFEIKKEFLLNKYTWVSEEKIRNESARDSALFSRKEGHEVLYMLQHVANYLNLYRVEQIQEVEKLIKNALPSSIRSWQKVMLWLVDKYQTNHSLRRPRKTAFQSFVAPRYEELRPRVFVTRDQIADGDLSVEATTGGWDTISSIRLPMVNKTLDKEGVSPKTFSENPSEGWKIDGEFGNWTLYRGGSGSILFMKTPIKKATMTFPGQPNLEITDGYVAISIKLKYLPQAPTPTGQTAAAIAEGDDTDGTPQYLARDEEDRSADDPAVVIQNVDYNGDKPSAMMDALFQGIMATWYNNNLVQFVYIFTTVNLNARAADGAFQWLKPTYTSYAYFNGVDDNSSFFGVLNMTTDASPEGLGPFLPPSAIPEGSNGSLLISNIRFLKNLVLPGLPKGFPNAVEGNFEIANNNTLIRNNTTIQMEDIDINGIDYTPDLLEFKFQIVGDEIQINSKIKVEVSPGIYVFVLSTNYYNIILVDKDDGSQTLDFAKSREPETDHYTEKSTGVIVTEIILAIIGAVATVVGGKVITETAKRIVAIIIIAIVAGLIAAIPTLIALIMEGKAKDALPSIGPLVTNAVGDIEWPDSSGFKLKKVELNGSLVLGGDLEY